MIALALAVLVSLLTFEEASARPLADSDGLVPVVTECHLYEPWFGRYGWRTHRDRSGERVVEGRIYLNWCRLERQGAGPNDIGRLIRHELAHSRGLSHFQLDPRRNPAYYEWFELCRC